MHAGDLDLPQGVSLAMEPDALILHVVPALTAEQLEADLGVPEGEAAEAAEPAAGKPGPARTGGRAAAAPE